MNITNHLTRKLIIYTLGMIMIAFGIVLLLKVAWGNSAWDTLNVATSLAIGITVGQANIIVAGSCTLFVTIYHKHFKYLLIFIPIIIVGLLIDLFNLHIILADFAPSGILRVIAFLFGLLLPPYGASLLVLSTFPAGVYEEMMLVLMKIFQTTKLAKVRIIMEVLVVLLALSITFLTKNGLGAVGVGTIIISFTLGPILGISLRVNKPLIPEQ